MTFGERIRRAARPRLPKSQWKVLWGAPAGRRLLIVAGVLIAATLVALLALWPGSTESKGAAGATHTEEAEVKSVTTMACEAGRCRSVEIELLTGRDRGRSAVVTLTPKAKSPNYSVGQRLRVLPNQRQPGIAPGRPPADLPGAVPGAKPPASFSYSIVDFDRRGPLLWLAIAFAVLVILAARWRGVFALVGLGVSVLIISQFVVPAVIAAKPLFLVALVGALAAMFVTVGLTSGLSAQSLAAALGIAASLLLTAILGVICVHIAHLNGLGSEFAFVLKQGNPHLSLEGLVLAGIVIGALGVLADMAVTQASAVMALLRANPELGMRKVYREAFTVGRDHLSATVNTLVFAYVGASLPLLVLFKTAGVTFTDAINGQDIAEAVVATLVGAIGVVASIPLTTGLAALLASGLPREALPADAHPHAH